MKRKVFHGNTFPILRLSLKSVEMGACVRGKWGNVSAARKGLPIQGGINYFKLIINK